MDLPARAAAVDPQFEAVLADLDRLSRAHDTLYRMGVGDAILRAFFDGDAAAYLSRDPRKPSRFTAFVQTCRAALGDLGLSAAVLRNCVATRIVFDSLPAALRQDLRFTHLVELAKVGDPSTRSLLATASVDNRWSADELRDAVLAVRAGRWIDADPEVPGLLPPEPEPEPRRVPQAGRVVTRVERAVADLDALAADWGQVSAEKVSRAQRKRLEDAVAALEARVSALRAALGAAG